MSESCCLLFAQGSLCDTRDKGFVIMCGLLPEHDGPHDWKTVSVKVEP